MVSKSIQRQPAICVVRWFMFPNGTEMAAGQMRFEALKRALSASAGCTPEQRHSVAADWAGGTVA